MKFTDEARQEAFLPVDERRSNLETVILIWNRINIHYIKNNCLKEQPKYETFILYFQGILCLGCRSAANYLLNKRRNENATDEFVKKLAKDICTQFEIMPEHVCEGLVNLNAVSVKNNIKFDLFES